MLYYVPIHFTPSAKALLNRTNIASLQWLINHTNFADLKTPFLFSLRNSLSSSAIRSFNMVRSSREMTTTSVNGLIIVISDQFSHLVIGTISVSIQVIGEVGLE
jgi:hypothetical protein